MKHPVKVLLFLLVLMGTAPAQLQRSTDPINDLRRQIEIREAVERDNTTSPDLRAANRRVLEQKKVELLQTVSARISQLQDYLAKLGDSITPEEEQYAVASLRALTAIRDTLLLRSDQTAPRLSRSSRPRVVKNQSFNYYTLENRSAIEEVTSKQSANTPIRLEMIREGDRVITGAADPTVSEVVVEIRTKEPRTSSEQIVTGTVFSHTTQVRRTPTAYRVVRFSSGQTLDSWRFSVKLSSPLAVGQEVRATANADLNRATTWADVRERDGRSEQRSPGSDFDSRAGSLKKVVRTQADSVKSPIALEAGSGNRSTALSTSLPSAGSNRVPPPPPQNVSNKKPSAVSQLFHRQGQGDATLVVNTPPAGSSVIVIPEALEVTDGTTVTVSGYRSPINKCTVTSTREELKPEPNALGALIGILAKAATSSLLAAGSYSPTFDDLCPQGAAVPVPADAEAQQIDTQLKSIRVSVKASYESMISNSDSARAQYAAVAKQVVDFAACKDHVCDTEASFNQEKKTLQQFVTAVLRTPMLSPASVDWQMAALKDTLTKRYAKQSVGDLQWLDSVNTQLDCYQRTLDLIKQVRDTLLTARTELKSVSDTLDSIPTTNVFAYEKALPIDRHAKVSGKVTCVNFITKQTAVEVPFTVTYENLAQASVSAGVLFSTLNRRQVTTQAIRTGTAADGTPTFKSVFAETDRAANQLVPFSFFNFYLSGTKRMNLNLTGGVGVNPNNGKTQIEFFAGGSLGIKNVYLHFGEHIGRWQEPAGDFRLGETVPDKFPGLGIRRRYSAHPAYGISYKLPLP